MTRSTKQLGFSGRNNSSVLRADLASPIRPGELVDDCSRKINLTVRSGSELPESMTDSNPQLDQERQKHNRWLVVIAGYKFLLSLMFAAVGIGALRLLHQDIDDVIGRIGDLLRFNPESRFVNFLYDKSTLINDPLLKRIGALAFSYAGVSCPTKPSTASTSCPCSRAGPGRRRRTRRCISMRARSCRPVRAGDWKLHVAHEYLTPAGPPRSDGKPANFENMKPRDRRQHRPSVAGGHGVGDHPRHIDADVRRQVGLVHHQQVRPVDTWSALAGDVPAAGDVEHEDLRVHQRRGERRGEVVAAGLDENDVERGEVVLEVLDGQQIGGDVVADGRVWAGAGLDRADPLRVEHARRAQEPRVLVGVDVVGDDAELQLGGQLPADRRDQRALAGADGPGDTEAKRLVSGQGLGGCQARNNLCVVVAWICGPLLDVRRRSAGIWSGAVRSAVRRPARRVGCSATTSRWRRPGRAGAA